MTNTNTTELLQSRPVWITHDEFCGGVVRTDTHDTQLTGKQQKRKFTRLWFTTINRMRSNISKTKHRSATKTWLALYRTEKAKEQWYILPSQVQCSRFKAPSALFQCCRWKKAYATASLSPLFKMCSGGRIRLFISNKYCRQQKGALQDMQTSRQWAIPSLRVH